MLRAMRSLALVGTLAMAAWVPAAYAQDAKRGEHVFRKCLLCHVVEPGSTSSIAPPLNDVVGRRAGIINGFQYSEIMQLARDKGLSWTEDALYQFLDKPEDFMPGTYMAFAGLEEQERRDVIAYLKQLAARGREEGRGGSNQVAPKSPTVATKPQDSTPKGEPGQPSFLPSVPPSMLQPKSAAGR